MGILGVGLFVAAAIVGGLKTKNQQATTVSFCIFQLD
jgi:hypothetical protein